MSAPTIKAGENPTADAAAAEHVKGLYSTGTPCGKLFTPPASGARWRASYE